ncbi:hypothetical protein [Nostoc sp.]|uniref:hypothetical protein n=1 Tax=Nostoc sp. TaxID=1180 RepID=UPI002FFD31B9
MSGAIALTAHAEEIKAKQEPDFTLHLAKPLEPTFVSRSDRQLNRVIKANDSLTRAVVRS